MQIMHVVPQPLKESWVDFKNDIKNPVSYDCHLITNCQNYCLEKRKRGLRKDMEDLSVCLLVDWGDSLLLTVDVGPKPCGVMDSMTFVDKGLY